MKINIQTHDDGATVALIGEFDTLATTEMSDRLNEIVALTDRPVTVDCSELEYISSSGLRFFMQLKRESEAKGGSIRVTHLNEDVNDIFRMSGFQNIFTIE
jgi:anti-sigma B factor antagonist